MLRPNLHEWPIWHDDPWETPQPHGGVAPGRNDLAISRYLEKQAIHRASSRRQLCVWSAVSRLLVLMAKRMVPRFVSPPGEADQQLGELPAGANPIAPE